MWIIYAPLAVVIASGCIGFVMLVAGMIGRVVEQAPHCGYCGYNLTGAIGSICPECGTDMWRVMVKRTRRQRRILLVYSGLIVLAPGFGILLAMGRQLDGYRLKPTAWVLRDAELKDDRLATRAIDELTSRYSAGQLNRIQLTQLKALAGGMFASGLRWSQNHLERLTTALVRDGQFSPSELDRLLSPFLMVRISQAGSCLPNNLCLNVRISNVTLPFGLELTNVQLRAADPKTPSANLAWPALAPPLPTRVLTENEFRSSPRALETRRGFGGPWTTTLTISPEQTGTKHIRIAVRADVVQMFGRGSSLHTVYRDVETE